MRPTSALLITCVFFFSHLTVAQQPAEVWVCPTGNCGHAGAGFTSLHEALNAVADGGTVHIAAGTYAGSVTITRSVTLRGAGASITTVAGSGGSDCIAIASSGVHLSGLTISGGRHGVSGTTSNSSIRQCTIQGFALDGVHLVNADGNFIEGNTINGASSGNGIALQGAQRNTIAGNTISANLRNIHFAADAGRPSRQNQIEANTLLDPVAWSIDIEADAGETKINVNVFKTDGTNNRYIRNGTVGALNAQHNWFGGEDPPQASDFEGNVDYRFHFATSLTIFMFPTIQYMRPGDALDVLVLGLVPAGTQVRGTTMTLSWNAAVTQMTAPPTQGSFYTQKLVGSQHEFFAFTPQTPSNTVTIDQSIMGGTTGAGNATGIPYVGLLCILKFQGLATGLSVVQPTGVLVRDPLNNPITASIVAPTQIYVDGQPPSITQRVIDNTTLNTDENGDTFDDYVKNGDNVTISALVTDNNPLSASRITADLSGFYGGSGHTAEPPYTYIGGVATWIVSGVNCSPANGTIAVPITARDTVENIATESASIVADNILPDPITGLVATPGHNKVLLSWANPLTTDAHYKGAAIRYNRRGGYPLYAAPAPAFPPTPTGGSQAFASAPGTSAAHTFTAGDRDIVYYSIFAVDWAGNYGSVGASGQDYATNYFLGDYGSGTGLEIPGQGGYDGFVNFEDLVWFSFLYGTDGSFPYPTAYESDIAPTEATKNYGAGHRFGIPAPDGRVNFEDLMIFSLNFSSVAPKIPSMQTPVFEALALSLEQEEIGEEIVLTLSLQNNNTEVKGCSALIRFDPGLVEFVGASNGAVFGSAGQGLYFVLREAGSVRVDAAVLGVEQSVSHSGTVAQLRFRKRTTDAQLPFLADAMIRDSNNASKAVTLNPPASTLPETFALLQNYPNPFNPATTIRFTVARAAALSGAIPSGVEGPRSSHVKLTLYDLLGREVATLVDEVKPPGTYTVQWDASGIASGIYFYRLKAGSFVETKKAILTR